MGEVVSAEDRPGRCGRLRRRCGEGQDRVCVDPARGAMSLSVWAAEWLERRVIGEATRRNYEGFVRNHLMPRFGRKSLGGLARRDFEKFVKDTYRGGAGLAASTVNDRMVMVAAITEAAVVDKRITENPARGIQISRRDAVAMDEDEVPTPAEVDLIAAHIAPHFRLTVYLQSGTGQRPSEALAFSTECRRPGFVRIRWQVSAKAHWEDYQTPFRPLKQRLEKGYRDIPTALFIEQEIDAHLRRWKPVPVVFTGQKGKRIRLETPLCPASAWRWRDAVRLLIRLPVQEGMPLGWTCRSGRQGQVHAPQPSALLRLNCPGKRRADPRGLALAGAPVCQDDGRHLRASAAQRVGSLPGCSAARHAACIPRRDVPAGRRGELERQCPSRVGVRGAPGLHGAGMERPCWDGAGMTPIEPAFSQVEALYYGFRFNV